MVVVLAGIGLVILVVHVHSKEQSDLAAAFEPSMASYLSLINQAIPTPAREPKGLVNPDFELFLASERPSLARPGRLLILETPDEDIQNLTSVKLSEVHHQLSDEVKAKSPSEVDTLVLLITRQEFLKEASGTQGARYREVLTSWMIDRATNSVLWILDFQAPEPSPNLPQPGSGTPNPSRSFVNRNKMADFLDNLSKGNIRPAGTWASKGD
ncbi:MAG TPA: hypothetical protein DCX07_05090 [Phycisphaerales bacterium]|nr:hypothetical protein [Phycisphaerales bacterium]